jgi:hypothetical protein
VCAQLRCYVYEALVVVLSSVILGLLIGAALGWTMSAQRILFSQLVRVCCLRVSTVMTVRSADSVLDAVDVVRVHVRRLVSHSADCCVALVAIDSIRQDSCSNYEEVKDRWENCSPERARARERCEMTFSLSCMFFKHKQ